MPLDFYLACNTGSDHISRMETFRLQGTDRRKKEIQNHKHGSPDEVPDDGWGC